MGVGETGDWAGATARIVDMINGKSDPMEGALGEGYGSGRLLEAFARELESEHGMELGMAFPTLLAAFSAAMQGGYQVPMIRSVKAGKPEYLWIPTVVQFVGIAEAGQQKSTLLAEVTEPLKTALDRAGLDNRRALVNAWRADALKAAGDKGLSMDANLQDWERVYAGGVCLTSMTAQGTPEGIRNNLVELGGHRAIITAEPDVLREVSSYTSGKGGGGSLVNFLNGWDQEDMAIDRAGAAGGGHFVREPSMPVVIMLQPASFRQYTGGRDGSDDFVARGVFSRMLLWQAERAELTVQFPDLDSWTLADGWDADAPLASKLGVLRDKLTDRMTQVTLRSNPYRVSKALEHSYDVAKLAWDMPRPKRVDRERLGLEGNEGHRANMRVQAMRAQISAAVRMAEMERPGIGAVLDPFAQRFTSHVMRLAGELSLADDPGACAVDTGHIEDVATRLMPWLWSGWWRVMRERMEESNRAVLSEGLLKNAKGKDLTGRDLLLEVLAKLDLNGPEALDGFLPSKICKLAEGKFPHMQRTDGLRQQLKAMLNELVVDGLVQEVSVAKSASGVKTSRLRITEMGRAEVKGHAA